MSDVKYPNETTKKALAELEAGKGEKFDDVAALMADLHEAAVMRPPDHTNVSSGHD
ncbi:hypothetical protein NI479_004893 [Salmonella enterica]|nr:hypothetical protein [Salmonella enterica]EJJ4347648.1 hypothetical protein [Salmonella enterica]